MFFILHFLQLLFILIGLFSVAIYIHFKIPPQRIISYLRDHKVIALFSLLVVIAFVFSEPISHHGMAITKENMYVNTFLFGSIFLTFISKLLQKVCGITFLVLSFIMFLLSMWIFIPHIFGVFLTIGKRIDVNSSEATSQQAMLLDAAVEGNGDSFSEASVADAIKINDLAMHLMIEKDYGKRNIRQFCRDLQSSGFGEYISGEINKRCLKIFKEYKIKYVEYEYLKETRTSRTKMKNGTTKKQKKGSIINKIREMLSDNFWKNQRAIIAYMIADYYCRTNNFLMFEKYSLLSEKIIGETCQGGICHASTKLLLSRCYEKFGFKWKAIEKRAEALSSLIDQREEERALRAREKLNTIMFS